MKFLVIFKWSVPQVTVSGDKVYGGNYTTSLSVTGLTVGKTYLFFISQYYAGTEACTIEITTGLTVISLYQGTHNEAVSGSPGFVIGTATATTATFSFGQHNGGITMYWGVFG